MKYVRLFLIIFALIIFTLPFTVLSHAAVVSADLQPNGTLGGSIFNGDFCYGYTFSVSKSIKYFGAQAPSTGRGASVILYDDHGSQVGFGSSLYPGIIYTICANPTDNWYDFVGLGGVASAYNTKTISGVTITTYNAKYGWKGSMPTDDLSSGNYLVQITLNFSPNSNPLVTTTSPSQNGAFHTERRAA